MNRPQDPVLERKLYQWIMVQVTTAVSLMVTKKGLVDIIRDYKDGLILYLNSFVADISVAEELAEDTFVKLGIRKPGFSGRSSFRTWLYDIGRNVAIDHIRKESKRKTENIDDHYDLSDEETLENAYIREEQKIAVHRAIRSLKPEYRHVLWLTYIEGFSNRDTSGIMKRSVHSVETLVYRPVQTQRIRRVNR